MDWSKGYSASYYISVVDPLTWVDIDKYDIVSGSIEHTTDVLLESADLECVNYAPENEQIIRIWLDARQNGESSHTPLFTGLTSSPEKEIEGHKVSYPLQCYSVLKIAEDVLLERGWFAPNGANGAEFVRNLLKVTGAPITVEDDSPTLETNIIAEDDENHLSMAWKILNSINWRITLDGYGAITIGPYSSDEVAVFDARHHDIIEPTLTITKDWYSCPNVYHVVSSTGESYTARDEDDDSMYSIQNRGREIWARETECSISSFETVETYAKRRLLQAQQISSTISYERRFEPDIRVTDVVRLNYPEQGISGYFMVSSQSVTLSHSAKTSEEVVKV